MANVEVGLEANLEFIKSTNAKLQRKIQAQELTIERLEVTNRALEGALTKHDQPGQAPIDDLFESMSRLLDWQSREISAANQARDLLSGSCYQLFRVIDEQNRIIQLLPGRCQRLISYVRLEDVPEAELASCFAEYGFDIRQYLKPPESSFHNHTEGLDSMLDLCEQLEASASSPSITANAINLMKDQVKQQREMLSQLDRERKRARHLSEMATSIRNVIGLPTDMSAETTLQSVLQKARSLREEAKANPEAAARIRKLTEILSEAEPESELIECWIAQAKRTPGGQEEIRAIFEGLGAEAVLVAHEAVRSWLDGVKREHAIIHEIVAEIGIHSQQQSNGFVQLLNAIRSHIRHRAAPSPRPVQPKQETSNQGMIDQLGRKLQEITDELLERNLYVAQLEKKLRETNSLIQRIDSEPNAELQAKLEERDELLRSIRKQLGVVDSHEAAIMKELSRLDKCRKIGSIISSRLKQILLKIADWAEQFRAPSLKRLSEHLVGWCRVDDPMTEVYELVCQVLDHPFSLEPGDLPGSQSSSITCVPGQEDCQVFAQKHSPMILNQATSWRNYCKALIYSANHTITFPIPKDFSIYFVQQLRVQKRLLLSPPLREIIQTRTIFPVFSIRPVILICLFLLCKNRSMFPNAAAAIERLKFEHEIHSTAFPLKIRR